jgi:endonuclease YncB( thermonuclease family)
MKLLLITYAWFLVAGLTALTITDGDTFVTDAGEKVRLIGIDCPERGRWYADDATALLDSLLSGKDLRFEYGDKRTDLYGRTLAYVFVDDTLLVNLELIKHGAATAFLKYPHEREGAFLEAELVVRRAGIGMWGSKTVRPPPKVESSKPKKESKSETVYITKSGSKYHSAGCQYLRKSKIPTSKKDAKARGYGPCSRCKP